MRPLTNHVCLGLRLESLSLGHVFSLAEISSPFLQGGNATLVDLSDAVFICSQDFRRSERDSRKIWFPTFLKTWARKCAGMDFDLERAKFETYIASETDFPATKQSAFGQKEFGSPWWWRLLAIMMSTFHLPEDVALDMPVQKCALLYTAKGEADGRLKVWTKGDQDFEDFTKAMDAREDVEFPEAPVD